MTNLLLIDSRIRDQQIVIDSLTTDTKYIIVDFLQDNLQSIKYKISDFNIQFINIGLFQENNNSPFYQFTQCFQRSILNNVQTQDPELNSWSEFIDILSFFNNNGMQNFDIMDCNIASDDNWNYVLNEIEKRININIHASTNETGNTAMNGDWILEKGDINLIGLYFTDNIKNYKYILGGGDSTALHSLIIANDGSVYACGNNVYGQLGNNTTNNNQYLAQMIQPNDLPSTAKAIKTAAGQFHSLVLYDNGYVYACGSNSYGQLGNGNNGNNNNNLILTRMLTPTDINGISINTNTKAINIAAGGFHSLVLYDDGNVYACGSNSYGQLGNGTNINQSNLTQMSPPIDRYNNLINAKAINIAAGVSHSLILYDDNNICACGFNNKGQLGNNTFDWNINPILTQMITTYIYGITINTKAINISAGSYNSLVLYDTGNVYGCGLDDSGELGIESQSNQLTFQYMYPPTDINGISINAKAINIAAGGIHSLVLYDNGNVYACGNYINGQVGNGKFGINTNDITDSNNISIRLVQMIIPLDINNKPITAKAINIAAGASHSIVLYDDGSVYACGLNSNGQLGTNSTSDSAILIPMQYQFPKTTNITNFNIGSTAIFCVIILNTSQIQRSYNATTNLTLTSSMYNIYTYIPNQPTLNIYIYTATFNNKNVGTNIPITINIVELKDIGNNTNYVFVNNYITTGKIISNSIHNSDNINTTPKIITLLLTSLSKYNDGTTNINYITNGEISGEILSIENYSTYIIQII